MSEVWQDPWWIAHTQVLLDSYQRWLGQDLLPRSGVPEDDARLVFEAPRVVLSHNTAADPILNYANQTALQLFEAELETLLQMPSRQTAEPLRREERARLLERTRAEGYVNDYRGMRITAKGRRFWIEQATVWNLVDAEGNFVGQGATFTDWTWET